MFDQLDGASVPVTSRYQSSGGASAIRRRDAGTYSKSAARILPQKSGEQSGWRDRVAAAVGTLLISGIVVGGVEVFERLWAHLSMVR